jgi:hypothetical protein
LRLIITQYTRFDGNLRSQLLDCIASPVFLHKTEHRTANDHCQHDDSIGPFAHESGNNGSKDKDENEWTFKLVKEQLQCRSLPLSFQRVQSILNYTALSLCLFETFRIALKREK